MSQRLSLKGGLYPPVSYANEANYNEFSLSRMLAFGWICVCAMCKYTYGNTFVCEAMSLHINNCAFLIWGVQYAQLFAVVIWRVCLFLT